MFDAKDIIDRIIHTFVLIILTTVALFTIIWLIYTFKTLLDGFLGAYDTSPIVTNLVPAIIGAGSAIIPMFILRKRSSGIQAERSVTKRDEAYGALLRDVVAVMSTDIQTLRRRRFIKLVDDHTASVAITGGSNAVLSNLRHIRHHEATGKTMIELLFICEDLFRAIREDMGVSYGGYSQTGNALALFQHTTGVKLRRDLRRVTRIFVR